MSRLYTRRPLSERFWEKVDKGDGAGCWLWTGGGEPYGRIRRGGRGEGYPGTHQVSWELHFGPIPAGFEVCHHCDNPPCVRPSHLFLGTIQHNAADRHSKGRDARGESHGRHLLTEVQVIELRGRYVAGETAGALGAAYGISYSQAKSIVRGEAWRHLPSPTVRVHRLLSDNDYRAIVAARASGETTVSIGRRYGVHPTTVSHVVAGRRRPLRRVA